MRRRVLWAITIVVVLILAVAAAAPKLMVWAASRDYRYTTATVPAFDVTLVLGAAMWADGPSPYLQARVDLAAALYQAGKTKVIIVSGSNTGDDDEPDGMRAALIKDGVPEGRIVLDFGGIDTYTSCLRARDVYGVRSLTVITQSYHLPRAIATCRGLGLDVVGIGDDTQAHDVTWLWYQAREVLADAKMVLDQARHRGLGLVVPSDDVRKALQGP